MRRILAATATLLTTTAVAQDRPNTILVMDGSGSMWGQIDGVAKITIAQDVVTNLIDTLPADQRLGLMAYGHRERGNCTDIEMLVEPGENTRDAIKSAVAGITPLGKTPMTDSIIAAAEALRYTEDSATVILVSDGVETCNPDPCAAARLMEEAGIDFTAHVVGFDVSGDAAALTQMQCIADETGGQFLTAENAAELGAALTAVVQEVEPELAPATLTALIGDDRRVIDTPILWDINDGNGLIVDDAQGNPLNVELAQGSYVATAYSIAQEEEKNAQFVVVAGGANTVDILFEEPAQTAAIVAPDTAPAGATIQVGWTGPDDPDDYVGVGAADATGAQQWRNYFYTAAGNAQPLLLPTEPGPHLIRYFQGADRTIIGEHEIMLTPVDATLTTPPEATAGADFEIAWTGPDYADDYIGIGAVDATGAQLWENYVYTRDGSPTTLTAPTTPGDYQISYFFGQDRRILISQPITLTDATAQIDAPQTAIAGETISVGWTGPDYDDDYIGIGAVDATGAQQWQNYAYTRDGAPAALVVPAAPGDYLISYFLGQDRAILTSVPITVTEPQTSVTAPTSAPVGSTISVDWSGPDYDGDYIGIGKVDANGAQQWQNYAYTRDGAPSTLAVPTEPGDYLVRYFFGQDRSIAAETTLVAEPLKITLTAPASAPAGSTISVTHDGPSYADDYIGVGAVDATGAQAWKNYVYTRDGNTLDLLVPMIPGDYIISYFFGQDRAVQTQVPLTVTPVTAQIVAPATAAAGSAVQIGWDGPGYDGDYIAVGRADAEGAQQWRAYAYAETGNPVTINLPDEPGDYLVRYFTGQDRITLGDPVPLTIQ